MISNHSAFFTTRQKSQFWDSKFSALPSDCGEGPMQGASVGEQPWWEGISLPLGSPGYLRSYSACWPCSQDSLSQNSPLERSAQQLYPGGSIASAPCVARTGRGQAWWRVPGSSPCWIWFLWAWELFSPWVGYPTLVFFSICFSSWFLISPTLSFFF